MFVMFRVFVVFMGLWSWTLVAFFYSVHGALGFGRFVAFYIIFVAFMWVGVQHLCGV